MNRLSIPIALLLACGAARAQTSLVQAKQTLQHELEQNLRELDQVTRDIADEKLPLNQRLSALEAELNEARSEFQDTTRKLEKRTLDITKLSQEIKAAEEASSYLSSLLGEYARNFESRLHIAEMQRQRKVIEDAKLAAENNSLPEEAVYAAQTALLEASIAHTMEALGGMEFEGSALDPDGLVTHGSFLLVGPAGLFRSTDGRSVGTVGQLLNSSEPSQMAFANPADAAAAQSLITSRAGLFPLDPTLGNAHKIESTEESFLEHVQKGGPVMIPIFAMAAAALLAALWKWISLASLRRPTRVQLEELLEAVGDSDKQRALEVVRDIQGPTGEMLAAGVEHMELPNELVEEVMYERMLTTRLQVGGILPFISICAASAPLLGLLGTVTGIINTFKLITLFGSGDVKMLSGGISEALITTKFGLIVAIPSLLSHAFLARKARNIAAQMEAAGISLINQLSKTRSTPAERATEIPPALGQPATSGSSGVKPGAKSALVQA